jgi:hypothetical protein
MKVGCFALFARSLAVGFALSFLLMISLLIASAATPTLGGGGLSQLDVSCSYRMTEFALSPDGGRVAELLVPAKQDVSVGGYGAIGRQPVLNSTPMGGGSCDQDRITVARISNPDVVVKTVMTGPSMSQLRWVTDRQISFVRGRDGRRLQFEDLRTKRVRTAVAAAHRILDYSLGPHARRVAYAYRIWHRPSRWVSIRILDSTPASAVALPRWATLWPISLGSARTGIVVAPVFGMGEKMSRVTRLNVFQIVWLSRPDRLAILRQSSPSASWESSLVDVTTGRTIVGPRDLSIIMRVAGSPSGRLALASRGPPDGRFPGFKRTRLEVLGKGNRVRRIPHLAGPVTKMWWQGNALLWVNMAVRRPGATPGDTTQELLEVDWRRGLVVRRIGWPDGNLESCQMDLERTVAVCLAETLTTSPRLVKVNVGSGRLTVLPRLSNRVRRLDFGFRPITVRNAFGRASTGFLALPPAIAHKGMSLNRKIPLAIMLYGFGRSFAKDGEWIGTYPVERLVNAGIAVMLLNYGRVHPYPAHDVSAARREDLEEPLSTLESAPEAVRAAGVRVGKVMVMGWSWGAFIAAHAINSCRFVAAEVGDPVGRTITSFALGAAAWSRSGGMEYSEFGGPPDERYIGNYLAIDPERFGTTPKGPIMLEFVSRNLDPWEYLNEWSAVGAYVEAFAYHYSVHTLNVPAEAKVSRARNLAWAKLNLLGPGSVSAHTLKRLGLTVPPRSAYRCQRPQSTPG